MLRWLWRLFLILFSYLLPAKLALRVLGPLACDDPDCVYCNSEVEDELRARGLLG